MRGSVNASWNSNDVLHSYVFSSAIWNDCDKISCDSNSGSTTTTTITTTTDIGEVRVITKRVNTARKCCVARSTMVMKKAFTRVRRIVKTAGASILKKRMPIRMRAMDTMVTTLT